MFDSDSETLEPLDLSQKIKASTFKKESDEDKTPSSNSKSHEKTPAKADMSPNSKFLEPLDLSQKAKVSALKRKSDEDRTPLYDFQPKETKEKKGEVTITSNHIRRQQTRRTRHPPMQWSHIM